MVLHLVQGHYPLIQTVLEPGPLKLQSNAPVNMLATTSIDVNITYLKLECETYSLD